MRIMKKTMSMLFLLIVMLSGLWAQETPVSWDFKTVKVNDSVAELQFKADIQEN